MKRIRYLSLLLMLLCSAVAWAQEFNPTNPSEPGQLKRKLTLRVSPTGAGSTSGSGMILPGQSVTVTASAYTGWVFVNWTDANGQQVSTSRSYTFTKGNRSETLTANFAFNPDGPSEPDELPHRLTLQKTEGGSVSGGGYYLTGATVNIYAYPYNGYDFDGWYDSNGTLYSDVAQTTYTMGGKVTTLTARFKFNPDSPAEPNEVNIWRLRLKAGDGGTVSPATTYLKEGETVTIHANTNSGYSFDGWYHGNEKVSSNADWVYTMGNGSVTLEARFEYQPANPDEPGQIKQRTFSFMLNNMVSKPGTTVAFPILFTPLATIGDITFQLNFDPRLNIDFENVIVGETTTPYEVTRVPITEGPTYDEGFTSYQFNLTGGTMVVEGGSTPKVTPILTFPFIIAPDIETGESYKVTINQISITNEDGSTQTAGTRNGLLTIYKNGDTNGDNDVNSADVLNIVSVVLQKETEIFISEVSDQNDDGEFTSADVLGIVNIVLGK